MSVPVFRSGTRQQVAAFRPDAAFQRRELMKGIVAWFLGVPIFVIILLYLTGIF
ncbi:MULTISPECIES: hypothetical protein [unclassified Paracoccus (in: a-proteobacteria)]|uniref:hypothetical protein n=1 Tax=unclassified Paracoccus (in: a-proteobacteria) TaxID=2688777 RepID=UPI0012B20591|nr:MULTISPECIES: hypothetical protein [unclassified Paracoccus (in: a-proteobacteria)]UXU73928.1 hypothetical protein GB879_008305 [Paracoccus sp. SMMA_5]UXU79815.1 hypothetical protein GB880_008285 [Paracoccus sp. SMMA_5_TC]